VRLAKKLRYAVAREDLKGLIESFRKTTQRSQDKAHHSGLQENRKADRLVGWETRGSTSNSKPERNIIQMPSM